MKLFSPTITVNESSLRCGTTLPGFLLVGAIGGSLLTVVVMRRIHARRIRTSNGPRTLEDRLREIDHLRGRCLITDTEQAEARARILNKI